MTNSKNTILRILTHLILIIFAIIAVYPVLQVVTISLRPSDKLLSTSLEIIPDNATLKSYLALFTDQPFLLWLRNSTFIAFTVTLTGVVLASMAGYVF